MSYSNLSPSSDSVSFRSKILSDEYNVIYDGDSTEKEKKGLKNSKAVSMINKLLGTYQLYVKLLLGRDIKKRDLHKFREKWGNFIHEIDENVLPEAILKFPNPDSQQCELLEVMDPTQAILFIQKVLKLDMKESDNQIFMKAVEGVYSKLLPCVKRSRKRFGIKQSPNFKSSSNLEALLDQRQDEIIQTPFESINQRILQNSETEKNVDALSVLVRQMQQKLVGEDSFNILQNKASEQFDIDYNIFKQMKSRLMQRGGYFHKRNEKWVRSGEDTGDFLTLMRNIILIRIMVKGFSVLSKISDDGKYIFCRIYAHERNLKTLAEQLKMKKKLNFQFTDLFSLEPVDNCYRPLRLNNRLWKPTEYDDLTDMFLYLRPKIMNLLYEINFKRISREINQSRINGQLFQYGKMDLQDDEEQPNDEQWFAYYQYLVHLEKQISALRKSFIIDSDLAIIINKQISPLNLYVIRNKKNNSVKSLNEDNIKEQVNRHHQQELKKIIQRVYQVIQECSNLTEKVPHTKFIKLFKNERLANNYFRAFEEALKVANNEKQLLFTIWDLIKVARLEPYSIYSKPSMLISPKMQFQKIMCWCKYQINECKKVSLFSTSERLKLTDQAINNMFQLNDMINNKVVSQFFCLNDHYELFGHLNHPISEIMVDDDFYKKKIYHLEFEWSFNIKEPWSTPIDLICEYYGQKIGLYFYYQTYYTKMLLKIAFIALGCNLVQWIIKNENDLNYLLRILFAFIQIQWTNLFVVLWQKEQIIFNLKFGQSGKDEIQVERSNFVGKCRRSVENDQMNSIGVDEKELYTRMILSTFLLIFLIGIYAGIMIGLYSLTISLKTQIEDDPGLKDQTFEVLITASINIIVIQFLDKVYNTISINLTEFENQKTVKDYEESFITKKYILYFISYVGPLIILAFLNEPFNLYCKATNCQSHIENHFATMIIWIFFFKTLKIFQLIYQVKKIPIFKYSFSESDIHKYIQEQSERKSYAISQERYGTLEDYMEIFLQNTLLSIFGYSFPFSFFLLWVENIAQMQADRAKFIYFLQRPWPQNNFSLGVWNKILELINYVCILTNTGQMTMEYNRRYGYEIILVFLLFLILNFAMNFVMNGTFGQIPYELILFIQRQKYLIRNTIEKFSKNQTGGQSTKSDNLSRFLIFKIFGITMDDQEEIFETVSSEDELKDHYELKSTSSLIQLNFLRKRLLEKKNDDQKKKEKEKKNDKEETNNKQKKMKKQPSSAAVTSRKSLSKRQNSTNRQVSQQNIDMQQMKKLGRQQTKKLNDTTFNEEKDQKKINQAHTKQQQNQKLTFEIEKQFKQQEEILSDEFMQYLFKNRKQDWAFQIKYWKRTSPQKMIRAIRFLYQKMLLSPRQLLWCDLRISSRVIYLKRKMYYLRDIDLRKLRILKKNSKVITEYVKEKAKKKFRKQFKMINPKSKREDDIKELKALETKFNDYVNKHSQLESTKVIVIKVKGIWFNQYRKQTYKMRSIDMTLKFRSKIKLINKLSDQSGLQGQLDRAIGGASLERIELIQIINAFLSISNQANEYEIPLCVRPLSLYSYYVNKKKSEVFTTCIDKFRDTFVFDHQYQKLQEISMLFFEEELFCIESIKFQRQLSESVWIANVNERQCLIQFLQIRHEQKLKISPQCQVNSGVYYIQGFHSIRLSNIIDQIDDFYIKGYCVIQYEITSQYTLKNILRYRSIYGLDYSLDDLYEFLLANLLLLQHQPHGDISINNYYLNGRTYVLLQTQKEGNDVINLAQVIIEMILLHPVDNPKSGYQQLYKFHPMRPILMDMIYDCPKLYELIERIPSKHSFMECNINSDERHSEIKTDENVLSSLALSIHQINFNFRMKLYEDALDEINNFEEYLLQRKFVTSTKLLDGFVQYLQGHQNTIISKQTEIQFIMNILLIIYIKFATLLQMRRNFITEMAPIQEAIASLIENIEDLIKQATFNIKFEQLSITEQQILLGRGEKKSQIDFGAKDRLLLIKKIRKHPTYMKVVLQLKKELMRYSLQFQTLHSIYLYFHQNFLYSAQMLENIVKAQSEFIQADRQIIHVEEEQQDLSPSQFNFDQQSPTLDATLKQYHQKKIEMQQEFYDSPNYCSQLMFYKYLYLIVLYDGGNEMFVDYFIDYVQEKIDSPVYEYLASLLQVMQKYEIPENYINFNKQCEIGKYIVITMNKWIEQTYLIPSKLESSNDIQFMWKQILTYSILEQSLQNRKILVSQLNQKINSLPLQLLEIRAIHQILHLDNYVVLSQHINFFNLDVSQLKSEFLQNSIINRLKELHDQVSIESNSWFHSKGLLQFRCFYLLSICFTFSKKHFENMCSENNNLLQLADIAFQNISYASETAAARIKALQILQQKYFQIDLKIDCKANQISQIINSYFYLTQHLSAGERIIKFGELFDQFGDQVRPSLVILSLISYMISLGHKDVAQLIVQFTTKLIEKKSEILENAHFSFANDVNILGLLVNQQEIQYLFPYDCLFSKSADIRQSPTDNVMNLRSLIYNQYFHQDINYNIDIMEDAIKLFGDDKSLIKLKQIYQLFLILMHTIKGDTSSEEIDLFIKLQFPQVTHFSIIIKNLIARYYINLKDYELAKPFIEDILSYLYTQERISYFVLSTEDGFYTIKNNITIYEKLFAVSLIAVQPEETDELYLHLIDEQFSQEVVINYLEVIANIETETLVLPKFSVIFSFFFSLKNFSTQQNLFKVLAQIFYSYSSPTGVELIQTEFGTIYLDLISQNEQQRNQLKEKMNHLFLTKQLSIQKSSQMNSLINLYSFIIGIYESINRGITKTTVLTWSISSAEKAIIGYKIVSKQFQKPMHYEISELLLLLIDCFRELDQMSTVIFYLDSCEEELINWFKLQRHPWKGHFFMKKGVLLQWMVETYKHYISILLDLQLLDRLEIFTIIRGILLQNRVLLQIFEQVVQGLINSEDFGKNLLQYLKSLDESQRVYFDVSTLYSGNDPDLMLQQATAISPVDFNVVNILMDAQSILLSCNQNNQFTQKLQQMIDKQISS